MNYNFTSVDSESFVKAADNGDLKIIKQLTKHFSNDANLLNKALSKSCYKGHLLIVKWLVEHAHVDVDFRGELYTPLTAACWNGHLEVVVYLVETSKADVNLPDRRGFPSKMPKILSEYSNSPLILSRSNLTPIVISRDGYNSLTISRDAFEPLIVLRDGYTPLISACRQVRKPVSTYLLTNNNSLDVNISDLKDNTALHYVVWCSENDLTPLHKICDYYSSIEKVIKLLYTQNHKINSQNNYGNTPLHMACHNGHSEIVKTLMLAGADETITNDDGKTCKQVAEIEKHSELLELLDRDSLQNLLTQTDMRSN